MFIYLLTNRVNGKYYVGQTRAKTAHKRFLAHGRQGRQGSQQRIHAAIRKYGFEVFEQSVLPEVQSRQQLDLLEQLWIAVLNSQDFKLGYNASPGGNSRSRESIEKQRAKLIGRFKGRRLSEETKQRISASRRGKAVGHIVTEETRAKIRARALARPNLVENGRRMGLMRIGKTNSAESNAKRSRTMMGKNTWMVGRKLSEEAKAKLHAAHRASGNRPPSFLGHKHTPETIEKMRAAKRRVA